MRAFITKAVAGSLIAGAALMVSACGSKTENTTDTNTTVTDMNATEGMDSTTDNMTNVDGATGNGAMMSNDSGSMMSNSGAGAMSNGSMMSNSTGGGNTM